jgi:phosphatidylinositol alpha-1,6-mannosyltransferase
VLTGRVPWRETPAFFDAGDVFAMPTRTRLFGLEPEALGICYLEAAATGLPVVAGSSGGAPDAVLHGENGYVVDGRDVQQVAARCSELLADRELAARFGARGRRWVAAQWRWDDLALRLHRILAGEPLVDERR